MSIKAEIIAIGDELISGDVTDINSAYISKKLTSLGIPCKFHTCIGDEQKNIAKQVELALSRSELIILTGGLGPTDDDFTAEAVAKALDKELIYEKKIWQNIKETLTKAGKEVDIYNKTQAYIPDGAKYFLNSAGTAPCIYSEIDDKKIFLLPGVPSEVKFFWEHYLENIIQNLSNTFIDIKKLKFAGIAEAKINEKLGDTAKSENPKIAFLPQSSEIIVKLTAHAKSEHQAKELNEKIKDKILTKIGDYFWGEDNDRVEIVIKELLLKHNLTVSTAESCTGGLISKLLTDIPGSSQYVNLNVVTYSNEAKVKMLNVKKETLEKHGAVSEQTASEMAIGSKNLSNSDIGISITGIAGPTGGSPEKPVGLCYIGISNDKITKTFEINSPEKLHREEIRNRAAKKALHFLKDFIIQNY